MIPQSFLTNPRTSAAALACEGLPCITWVVPGHRAGDSGRATTPSAVALEMLRVGLGREKRTPWAENGTEITHRDASGLPRGPDRRFPIGSEARAEAALASFATCGNR